MTKTYTDSTGNEWTWDGDTWVRDEYSSPSVDDIETEIAEESWMREYTPPPLPDQRPCLQCGKDHIGIAGHYDRTRCRQAWTRQQIFGLQRVLARLRERLIDEGNTGD